MGRYNLPASFLRSPSNAHLCEFHNCAFLFLLMLFLICYHNYDKISIKGVSVMESIRPISDLRNNFADISKTVHETGQPVFLTRNGYGDMVVMSMEAYENMRFESEVYSKLAEAEREAEMTQERFSSKDVLAAMLKAARGE